MGKSQRRANQRDNKRVLEGAIQAHDRLHKDDIAGCHDLLHYALGVDDDATEGARNSVEPLSQRTGWDKAFRDLCRRFDVKASFVLVDSVDEAEGTSRLLSGGDGELCGLIDTALRGAMVDEGSTGLDAAGRKQTESGLYIP